MGEAVLITGQDALEAAVFRMRAASRLALDTEFMRERTYHPQLCLIQLATDSDCWLVDTLAGLDLAPLFELLCDSGKLKILHAARQDLEALLVTGGRLPLPVFDTQVAAGLLGMPPQLGYADLVARQLGHSLDKGQTRTDWSRRPLSPAQLAYAADDVNHLLLLHSQLEAALTESNRLSWAAEEAAALGNPALFRTDPAQAWRRLKGLGRLRPEGQAVARALAQWREQRALESDKPRGWILNDDTVYAIATALPASLQSLEAVPSLPPATLRKRGEELLQLINRARLESNAAVPASSARRATPEETALAARLMQIVRETAAELGIASELLATRRDIDAMAFGERDTPVTRGWRRAVVGARLLAALP